MTASSAAGSQVGNLEQTSGRSSASGFAALWRSKFSEGKAKQAMRAIHIISFR